MIVYVLVDLDSRTCCAVYRNKYDAFTMAKQLQDMDIAVIVEGRKVING